RAEPRAPPAPMPDIPLQGPVHAERLRLGGASVPLPPGRWVEIHGTSFVAQGPPILGGGRSGGGAQMLTTQEVTLVRQEAGRITGVVVAQVTTSDVTVPPRWPLSEICGGGEALARAVVHSDAVTQDCARLIAWSPQRSLATSGSQNALAQLGARRAGFLPPDMPAAQFRFAGSQRAVTAEYRFAPPLDEAARSGWLQRFGPWLAASAPVLRRGFNGWQAGPLADP
ncbi:MAG TPA: hypothetical protein VD970_03485, partial [Acetobacteraceae bacterium]|nr:hypothetical protein [Acetobacteraceae bacterium]